MFFYVHCCRMVVFACFLSISMEVIMLTTRLYAVTDAKMLSSSSLFSSKLIKDIAAFTAFAPKDFPTGHEAAFEERVREAHAIPGDEIIRLELSKRTQHIADVDKELRLVFKNVRFYIEHTIKDAQTLKQFGIGTFSKLVKNSDSLILFMTRLNPALVPYKAVLIAAGCSEALLNNLATQTESLIEARNAQAEYKIVRAKLTIQRLVILNEIWKIMQCISDSDKIMAQVVPGWTESYFLPHPSPSDEPDPEDPEE